MNENKEEIRYILKFYYKKGKNATQAAKKICDLWTWCSISTCGTKLIQEFSIWKFWCTLLVDHWKNRNKEKVEQDRHISNHDIDKDLNRPQNNFKSFGEGWIQKECLSATWFNSEKFNGSNYNL